MDELEPIILLIVSGLLLRFSLTFTGQAWAKSHAQTVTFMVLPIITYVITKTISGNIALSLGMIGALSIVRFRHPVKSALELVIYFALITIGIACSVFYLWGVFLGLFTFLTIIIVYYLKMFLENKTSLFLFNYSFEEGENNNVLEISVKGDSEFINKSQNILSKSFDKDNNTSFYRLVFKNKEALNKFVDEAKNEDNLISYEVKF